MTSDGAQSRQDEEANLLDGSTSAASRDGRISSYQMGLLWFAAACCVMLGGIIGTLSLVFTEFKPADILDEVYLILFGTAMGVFDFPISFSFVILHRFYINKYARFLTRLTGRGVFFIFLGTMTFASLWNNSISYFLALVLGFFVVGVGIFSALLGFSKSRRLERIRKKIVGPPNLLEEKYKRFAVSSQEGLSQQEFKELALDVDQLVLEEGDLKLVFNALSRSPKCDRISKADLEEWEGTPGYAIL